MLPLPLTSQPVSRSKCKAFSRADVLQQRVAQLQVACNEADARAGHVQPVACHSALPSYLSTASLAAKLVAATAATVPQPSSHSHDAATTCLFLLRSFLESAASSGPMSSPISTFQRLFYIKFRPFPFSFLCAGALNKSAAAAASIIISSLSYSCDHSHLPHVHVPQLLMV